MNFTRDYHDNLEGDFLACKPGSVAEGLEFVCTFGMPILGSAWLLIGGWLLYIVFIQRRDRKLLAKQRRDASYMPNAQDSQSVHAQSDATNMFSYIEKVLLSLGVASICASLMFLLYGVGTMYPTTHIRGQIGDVVCK